jgi:hypothetical protein
MIMTAGTLLTLNIVPTLCVGMQFLTLCVIYV